MLMKKYVLIRMALAAILINASAQADPLPSQIDMKAAYCIQVTQDGINDLSIPNSNETAGQKQLVAEVLEKANSNLRHLQRYLVARMQYLDPLAITAAKQQAIDDRTLRVKDLTTCGEPCISKQDLACMKNCSASVNAKAPNCSDLSFLPF